MATFQHFFSVYSIFGSFSWLRSVSHSGILGTINFVVKSNVVNCLINKKLPFYGGNEHWVFTKRWSNLIVIRWYQRVIKYMGKAFISRDSTCYENIYKMHFLVRESFLTSCWQQKVEFMSKRGKVKKKSTKCTQGWVTWLTSLVISLNTLLHKF